MENEISREAFAQAEEIFFQILDIKRDIPRITSLSGKLKAQARIKELDAKRREILGVT